MADETERMYKPKELQARWRCGDGKVREFIQSGQLTAFNLATASSRIPRYLIPEWAVIEFEAARMTAPRLSSSPLRKVRTTKPPSRY
jgi:hypothetical protein